MSATVLIENKEINETHRVLSNQYRGRKEDYFALLYLTKRFKIPIDEAASFVSFGGNASAIDSFYYDKDAKMLYLFLFKCSDDHLQFKEPIERLALVGVQRLFASSSFQFYEGEDSFLTKLRACITDNHQGIEKITIHPVFNGDPVRAEKSRVLEILREYLESKKYIIDGFFGRDVDMIFQVMSSRKAMGHAFLRSQSPVYSIPSPDVPMKVSSEGNELILTFVPVGTLYRMYADLGDRFFEKNIRCEVNNGKMTRYEIKRSLSRMLAKEEPPENFAFYHNGVTLTAQQVALKNTAEENKQTLAMVEPRLLNGVQTIKTVRKFVDEKKGSRKKVLELLDKVKVMARVVRSREEEFLKKVTISNNRQNPIMPWNLRANDLVQLHLEENFRDKLGIYYERRENSLEDLTDEDLEEMSISQRRAIKLRKLAQTLLALHGEIERISQMKQVFESEKWYANTFRQRYLEVDPRKLVLLYKVHYRLLAIVKQIQFLGYEKYDYLGKLRNLVWSLAIQGLLNEDKFDSHVQAFGTSLTIEANFNVLLKNISTMKLRIILGTTFGEKKYRDYLKDAKYSFLNTKTAFNDCMSTAGKEFGWEKKDI